MMLSAKLDAAIKAVCPIHGISIGRKEDKSTWRLVFKDEATAEQKAKAQAVVDAFDVAAEEAKESVLKSLEAIDEATGMNRGLREFILASVEMSKILRTTNPTLPDVAGNVGIVKVGEAEAAASALRKQL